MLSTRFEGMKVSTVLLLLALSFIFLIGFVFQPTEASHFQFGNFEWEYNSKANTAIVTVTQAWRYNYFGFGINNIKNKTPAQIQAWIDGRGTTNVGTLTYGTTNAAGTTATSMSSQSLQLQITQAYIDPMYANSSEGWWFGTRSYSFADNMSPSGWATNYKNNDRYIMVFYICCRINALRDGNGATNSRHWMWWGKNTLQYSVQAAGFPREFIETNVQLSTVYRLSAVNRQDPDKEVKWSVSPGNTCSNSSPGGSCLSGSDRPGKASGSLLNIVNNVAEWLPTENINSCTATPGYCAYAFNVAMTADSPFTSTFKLATQLDFLFIVQRPCTSGGNCPPKFTGQTALTVISTVPFQHTLTVADPGGRDITIENTPIPTGMTLNIAGSGSSRSITINYDQDIDGAQGAVICFKASNSNGMTSIGSHCPILTVIKPEFMFITGTMRTFTDSEASANQLKYSSAWPTNTAPVNPLPSSREISFTGSTQFNNWFTSGTPKLYTFTMIRYYNSAADPFLTQDSNGVALPALPSNTALADPRRRVFSFRRPYWEPQVNTALYFTYEFHTVFDLLTTETGTNALKFASTGGELFVYINQKLMVSITNRQTTPSATESALIASPPTVTLTAAKIISDLGLSSNQVNTLDLDVFYTHRNLANSGFHIEFGSSTACSAINILSSPRYSHILESARLFSYSAGTTQPAGTQAWNANEWTTSNLATTFTNKGLTLLTAANKSSAAVAYWKNSGNLLKILSGFEAKFTFTMSSTSPGFAFVLQANSPTGRGSEGSGMGYNGLNRAIAVEFDTWTDAGIDDGYPTQHISVHRSSSTAPYPISAKEARESWPTGSTPIGDIPLLPFTFTNSSAHVVRAQFAPTANLYLMTLYLNDNVRPVYTAQFARSDLETWFEDGAYVGFTTANSETRSGDVVISTFDLTIVPPLAEQSLVSAIGPITNGVYQGQAGQQLGVSVQLRDACGSDLFVKGEGDRFTGYFIHEDYNIPQSTAGTAQGTVYDLIQATVTDAGRGKYTFTGLPTRSGKYRLYVYYREVNQVAPYGQPIGAPPFASLTQSITLAEVSKRAYTNYYSANVEAGLTSSQRSFYIYPVLSTSTVKTVNFVANNANQFTGYNAANNIIACIEVDEFGNVIQAVNFSTQAEYTAFHNNATKQFAVCAIRGAFPQALIATVFVSGVSFDVTKPSPVAGVPTTATGLSAMWVLVSTTVSEAYWSTLGPVIFSSRNDHMSMVFHAESKGPQKLASLFVNSPTMIVPTATESQFYLYSRDAYGNPTPSGATFDITYPFTPGLVTATTTESISGTPFSALGFLTGRSGSFDSNIFLADGTGSQVGVAAKLLVSAGAAHYSTSQATGVSIGGRVGSSMSFTITLFDIARNQVVDQSNVKREVSAIRWVPVDGNGAIANDPLYFVASQITNWNTDDYYYTVNYTPRFAGTFYIKIYINSVCSGSWTADASWPEKCAMNPAYELTATVSSSVSILAGPAHYHSVVTQQLPGGNDEQIDTNEDYLAGAAIIYNIQTKDMYGNNRLNAIDGLNSKLTLSFSGVTTAVDFQAKVDTAASSRYVAGSAELVATSVGSGRYRITVVFKQAGAISGISIKLITDTDTAGKVITRVLTPGVDYNFKTTAAEASDATTTNDITWNNAHTTTPFQAVIKAGEISSPSTLQLWCPTGYDGYSVTSVTTGAVCSDAQPAYRAKDYSGVANVKGNVFFLFRARDIYSNELSSADHSLTTIQSAFSVQFESSTYNYFLGMTQTIVAVAPGGVGWIGALQTTTSGEYTLSPLLSNTNAPPTGAPWKFTVLAADTSLVQGDTKGTTPTVQWPPTPARQSTSTFYFHDRDVFNNGRYPVAALVPETTFKMFYSMGSTTTCTAFSTAVDADDSAICGVSTDGARPAYQCALKLGTIFGAGQHTFYLSTGSCITDSNGCPSTSCSTSQTLRVLNNGNTQGWVRAVSVGTQVSTVLNVEESGTGVRNLAISGTNFRAGQVISIWAIDGLTLDTSLIYSSDLADLRLLPDGSTSQFSTVSAVAQACPATSTDPVLSAVCAGLSGKAIWKFDVRYTKTTSGSDTQFSVWSTNKSTVVKAYTFSIFPAQLAPNSSTPESRSSLTSTAGQPWSFGFRPRDTYGNSIITNADFPVSERTLQCQLYRPTNEAITQRGVYNFSTKDFETITQVPCVCDNWAESTNTDPGLVTCAVPGGYFVEKKLELYYFGVGLGSLPTNVVTGYVGNSVNSNNVSAGSVKLQNTLLSLMPTSTIDWNSYPQTASENFKLYIFPRDSYNNPTTIATTFGSIDFTVGDTFTTKDQLNAGLSTKGDWTEVSTSVYNADVQIRAVTRSGFQFRLANSGDYSPTYTIKLRSSLPAASATNALYTTGTPSTVVPTPITGLTIDSSFEYLIKLTDPNGLPFLYNVAANTPTKLTDDLPSLLLTLTRDSTTLPITVETVLSNGIVKYGEFKVSVAQSTLALVNSNYKLTITVSTPAGNALIKTYTFEITPGNPYIDNTLISFPTFNTGVSSQVKFTLYDRLYNKITANKMSTAIARGKADVYFPITTRDNVYPSIHEGQAQCQDIHDNSITNNLQWKLPFVTPSKYPDIFTMEISGPVSGEYTAEITPAPRGTYTFNLTYIDQNLIVPASTYTCVPLIPNSFTVLTGPPVAAQSYFNIVPTGADNWGKNTAYVGNAGQTYDLNINLLDRDGSPSTQSSADILKIFSAPTGVTGFDKTNALWWTGVDAESNMINYQITDLTPIFGVGIWRGSFTPITANALGERFEILVYLQEDDGSWKRISGTDPTTQTASPTKFTVNHGAPTKIVVQNVPSNDDVLVAGNEYQFQAYATDTYGNRITTNTLSTLSIVIQRDASTTNPPIVDISGLRWTLSSDLISTNSDGLSTISFTPVWEGKYSIELVMVSTSNGGYLASATIPSEGGEQLKIFHASCAGQSLGEGSAVPSDARNVCASTGQCVVNYSDCPQPSDKVNCAVGEIIQNGTCTPIVAEGGLYVQCSDGSYIVGTLADCPAIAPCPSGTLACPNSNQCRSSLTSCPSTPACPTGTFVCPNLSSCATSLAACPTIPNSWTQSCEAKGYMVCPTSGSCVPAASDCPTPATCPVGQVLCLTDHSCRAAATECPNLPIAEVDTPASCVAELGPDAVLCPTGICAASMASCPSAITCPVGSVLCASDNTCKRDISLCNIVAVPPTSASPLPDPSTLACSATEFRCTNGACVQNLMLCPTPPSCYGDKPVLCADQSCKASLALCTTPPSCPTGTISCPVDGTCVATADKCPVMSTCSAAVPVKCPSGACAVSTDKCSTPLECPPSLPFACSSGVCRSSRLDCPTKVACPAAKPLTCPDGSCAISLDMCSSVIAPVDPANPIQDNGCLAGYTRCPSGECTPGNLLTCPTHVTCPLATSRCADGTCRSDCSSVLGSSCAELNLITCPIASSGVACARTLVECPQSVTCPISRPVKCAYDVTCAVSINECAAAPADQYPTDRTPCADGSWILSGSTCPTPITCVSTAPIKCYDGSCSPTLEQCPIAQQCPEASSPYRCPSGACAATPWACISTDPVVCPTTTPIKCQTQSGSVCKASLSECPTDIVVGSGEIDTTVIPDPDEIYKNPCATGFTLCRDGSCAESPAFCPALTCPVAFPVICDDGSCAADSDKCPASTGCPYDAPQRCPGIGNCVSSLAKCQRHSCAVIACQDGTCAENASQCKAANGCSFGQTRCADGNCVSDKALCISAANTNSINSCPAGAPFRCASGLCVISSSACTTLDPTGICTDPKKPVLCATGQCTQSTELCPLVKPCEGITTRCDDGLCRNLEADPNACPNYSSCPIGQIRCKQGDYTVPILDGLCALPGKCLSINGCEINPSTGSAFHRCANNGRCVADISTCDTQTPLSNGCFSNTPVKCWNGECSVNAAQCDATNNCPYDAPHRCADGSCSTDCSAVTEVCSKVKCGDGSCADTEAQCTTTFGCPVDTPVRCHNGQCKKYPATFRNPKYKLTNAQINTLTCPPVASCPSSYAQCEDGSCVLSTKLCPSITYTCTSSQFRCLDGTCRPSTDFCGYKMDETDPTQPALDENGEYIPSSDKPLNCPQSLPIICPNGACVGDYASCDLSTDPVQTPITGSPTSSQRDTTLEFQVLCNDGSWRDSYADCRAFTEKATANSPDSLKCVDYCADGTCILSGQTAAAICPIVAACPVSTRRCFDGSCRKSCADIVRPVCEVEGTVPNVDGQCRLPEDSLPYNGCGMEPTENYQCKNRECSSGPADCKVKASPNLEDRARVLLTDSPLFKRLEAERLAAQEKSVQSSTPTISLVNDVPNSIIYEFALQTAFDTLEGDENTGTEEASEETPVDSKSCTENCVSDSNLASTGVQYSPLLSQQSYLIGPSSTAFTLTLYSGLQVNSTADTNIYIQPVPTSLYFNATNRVTYSRIGEFGETLTAAQTILSPVFSCSVGDGIIEPFDVNVQLSSLIDRSMKPSPAPTDVCLAVLSRHPEHNYAVWQCLFTDEQRQSGDLRYSTRQSTTQSLREAISFISQCYDPTLSKVVSTQANYQDDDIFSMLQDTTIEVTTKVPAVYAFIHQPVNTGQVYLPSADTFFKNNIIWLLFVIIGAICLIFFLVYAVSRLSRYSNKTDKIKDEIDNTEKEIAEMEQYGEKRRDQEVGYVANPLAISLEQQKALEDTTSEEKLARRQQVLEAQQLDSAERKEVIDTLEADNAQALAALEALRRKAGNRS